MNTTELIISPENQVIIDAINSTGKTWFELPISDHPIYPQFARKLVVTGFNTPDMKDDEDRIYVNVRQYLILKEGGTIHKKIKMKDWFINENNVEDVMGAEGLLTGTLTTKDAEGNIISEVEEILKAKSVQYVRFLLKSKSLHLSDILTRFMSLYAEIFATEINDI